MDATPSSSASAPPAPADEAMPCPGCGYDLRAATTDVCSECGLKVDPAILRESGFPWAHRRRIGRVPAYLLTVWLVTIGSKKLAYEAARPQDLKDGRRFMWVTEVLVSLFLSGAFLMAIDGAKEGLQPLAYTYSPRSLWRSPPTGSSALEWDVAVPWSAGATLWPTWGCIGLLAVCLTRAVRAVIRGPGSEAQRLRIRAIACYASAPLALLWLSAPFWGLALAARATKDLDYSYQSFVTCAVGVVVIVLAAALYQSGRWMARTTHCGIERGLMAGIELALLWIAGVIVLLGLFPWCVGLLWIAVDSLR